jgi:hypothetical protein
MYISVDVPEFDTSEIEKYFNCEDPILLATFDKMFGAAAMEAIYADPDIPTKFKGNVAKRAARELQDAFRGAKVEYEFASGKYGVGQESVRKYERAKKEIYLCRKATWLDKLKQNLPRLIAKLEVKSGAKSVLKTLGTGDITTNVASLLIGLAVDTVWYLTPKGVKNTLKRTAGELAQKSRAIINTVSQKIKSSPIVQKAKAVVEEYVAPHIRPIYDEAKSAISSAAKAARKGWKAIKSVFA